MPKFSDEQLKSQDAHRRAYKTERGRAWKDRKRAEDPDYFARYEREKKAASLPKPAKLKFETQADYFRFRRYGLTPDDYRALVEKQNGCCAICGRSDKLVVDHCHDTKEVRGLLCTSCNTGLGRFGDSVANLMKAITYLGRK